MKPLPSPADSAPSGNGTKTAQADGTSLLKAMLDAQPEVVRGQQNQGVLIGWIAGIGEGGVPEVMVPGTLDEPTRARSLCVIASKHVGAQCALMFEACDREKPLIMGLLQEPVLTIGAVGKAQVHQTGRTVDISADEELALYCGKASLRLTRDGRIELRGTTVISHATGLNRVRGASIKLN